MNLNLQSTFGFKTFDFDINNVINQNINKYQIIYNML